MLNRQGGFGRRLDHWGNFSHRRFAVMKPRLVLEADARFSYGVDQRGKAGKYEN